MKVNGRNRFSILALLGCEPRRFARASLITEFPIPTANSLPFGIAAGPDGNLWFTEQRRNQDRADHPGRRHHRVHRSDGRQRPDRHRGRAGRQPLVHRVRLATRSGGSRRPASITEFPVPTAGSGPSGIAAGPDGNLWFTEYNGNQIGRITPAGVDHRVPRPHGRQPALRASRPARTATSGSPRPRPTRSAGSRRPASITEFPHPDRRQRARRHHGRPGRQPLVHRERRQQDRPDHARPASSPSSRSPRPAAAPAGSRPGRTATSGSPRAVGNQIGRITPAGVVTEFPMPASRRQRAVRPSRPARTGDLWFSEFGQEASPFGRIGRITTGGLKAQVMLVDAAAAAGTSSNTNGVLETGETVQVAPAWLNSDVSSAQTFTGTASNLTGPGGPTYAIDDDSADFGTVDTATTQDCATAGGDCYRMTVSGAPAQPALGRELHREPQRRLDGPFVDAARRRILSRRADIAAVLPVHREPLSQRDHGRLRRRRLLPGRPRYPSADGGVSPEGHARRTNYTPPASETLFADVSHAHLFADWIDQLANQGITAGCGGGLYCPTNPVRAARWRSFC